MGAKPIAQSLRLRDPQTNEFGPRRLDELHLIAVLDHAPAQPVQGLRIRFRPILRHRRGGAPVGDGELPGRLVAIELVDRPSFGRRRGARQRLADPFLEDRGEACRFGTRARRGDPCPDRGARSRRQQRLVVEIASASSAAWLSRANAISRARLRTSMRNASASAPTTGAIRRRMARHRLKVLRSSCTATASAMPGSSSGLRPLDRVSRNKADSARVAMSG